MQVVTLLAAMSSALSYCHDQLGVLHGGLGPGRVLFAADGRPMLAGLGAVDAALAAGGDPPLVPGHVSPALARGRRPHPADDIFALGSVALESLCGAAAWPADEIHDVVIQSALGQWPAPDESCPAGLGDLLRAMLARDPADRPSAADVYRRLATCGPPEPVDLLPISAETGQAESAMPASAVAGREVADASEAAHRPAMRRRGRHAEPDENEPEPVAFGDQAPRPTFTPAGWLDAPIGPSWSLRAEGAPGDEDSPPPLAVAPLPSSARTIGRVRRPLDRRHAHRQPERLRRTVLTCLVALALAAGSVLAGLWWASSDATAGAVLPAVTPAASTEDSSTATAVAKSDPVDWSAVVTDLDRRRSAAFAANDASLLATVYTPGSAAMAVDVDRINQLVASGVRVNGLQHAITSVRLLDPATLRVEVVDSMPALPILDVNGAVVAHTAEQLVTTRVMRLIETAGDYRIVEVTGPG